MLTSLAFIILLGLLSAALFQRLHLPRIIGMLLTGILLGPYVLGVLDEKILGISSELRKIALIIILIKAGLSLDPKDLKKVGRPAILLSFLPAVFEMAAVTVFAPLLLPMTHLEAAIAGAVLGAVSPAIVVPRMVELIENGWGTEKGIPQMILTGASLDDVFVIVLFSTFVSMGQGQGAKMTDFFSVPISILLGILTGAVLGLALSWLFEAAHKSGRSIRQSFKVLLMIGTAFLLTAAETWLEGIVPLSGLLAVISMACTIRLRSRDEITSDLSAKYGRLWLAAEILLFVLVGAAVDVRYTLSAGLPAAAVILSALVIRSVGVWICLLGTNLNKKEKLYCVLSYLPKATVQAAIGSVPLSLGLSCGSLVLTVAVLSILLTAPLGAIAMDLSRKKLLSPYNSH